MQIPLQEKIAELEQRIVALEKKQKTVIFRQSTHLQEDLFGEEWNQLWRSFDALFRRVFNRSGAAN